MASVIEIRPLAAVDVDVVAELHVESWRVAYRGIVPDDLLDGEPFRASRFERWRSRRFDDEPQGCATLVAELDGAVVGFADVGPERPQADGRERGWGEVYAFYLHPSAWGSGAAAPLMAACVQRLADAGFADAALWVFRDNARARAFYARTGWVHAADRAEHIIEFAPGVGAAEVIYQRSLPSRSAP